jgi:hypothetical protein
MTYDNLKELAEKFFEQPGVSDIQMRFKEDRVIYPAINLVIDSRIDPLTLWSWAQCQNPKTLFVLKDWYNKDGNSGTVRESVEWSKQRWQDESKWDPTLTRADAGPKSTTRFWWRDSAWKRWSGGVIRVTGKTAGGTECVTTAELMSNNFDTNNATNRIKTRSIYESSRKGG